MDHDLLFLLYGKGGALVMWTMVALSVLGSGWSMLGFGALFLAPRTRPMAWPLAGALVTNGVVVFALKALVGRPRPCVSDVKAIFFAAPTDGSLPSGHAAGAFCVATFCAIELWRSELPRRVVIPVALTLAVLAVGIAASRVYLGVHYPLDVGAGAALGTLIGAAFALRRRPGSIQTAPAG